MANGHGGARPGAGRKPGVPNKIAADLKDMIRGALEDAGGREYLARQAEKNPTAFMTLIGKLVPTTADVTVHRNVRDLSVAEILAELAATGIAGEEACAGEPEQLH